LIDIQVLIGFLLKVIREIVKLIWLCICCKKHV